MFICVNCKKKILDENSDIYFIKGLGQLKEPCCSLECAENFKLKQIKILKKKYESQLKEIENQIIEKG